MATRSGIASPMRPGERCISRMLILLSWGFFNMLLSYARVSTKAFCVQLETLMPM